MEVNIDYSCNALILLHKGGFRNGCQATTALPLIGGVPFGQKRKE